MTIARVWRSKLLVPIEHREQEHLNMLAGVRESLWPNCLQCTAINVRKGIPKEDAWETVTSYGVEAFGRTPGRHGVDYTDEFAIHHGEKDIIRIEGFRWDKVVKEWNEAGERADRAPILAAIKALPFFAPGAIRVIPKHVFLNFMARQGR